METEVWRERFRDWRTVRYASPDLVGSCGVGLVTFFAVI